MNAITSNNLISTLRRMRKLGFSLVQDVPGSRQTHDEQMKRARSVVRELLNLPSDCVDPNVEHAAETLLQVAENTRQLPQFDI